MSCFIEFRIEIGVALMGSPSLAKEPQSLGCRFEVLAKVEPEVSVLDFSRTSFLPSLVVTLKALLIGPTEKPAGRGLN